MYFSFSFSFFSLSLLLPLFKLHRSLDRTTRTHTHPRRHTLSLSHTRTLSLSHTLSLSLSHTHTHSHTHTPSNPLYSSVAMLYRLSVLAFVYFLFFYFPAHYITSLSSPVQSSLVLSRAVLVCPNSYDFIPILGLE